MGERRYGVGSRGRSPSPRRPSPRSRDFNPSKHRKNSPYHRRGKEQYSRDAERSPRIERRDHFHRDSDSHASRFSEYDNKDRDRYAVGGVRYRSPWRIESPQRIEKWDNFDRDGSMRTVKLSDYEDGGKDRYQNGVTVGRSRIYDEGSYRGDSSSSKFQVDHLLDGPKKSDHFSMRDYSHTRYNNGVGDMKVISGGGERDYYPHSRYLDSDQVGLSSVSQHLDSVKPVPLQYERGGRMHSHSYTLAHGGVDDIPVSNLGGGDGSSHIPSVASRYLNTDTDKLGYVHFWDELHLENRDGGLPDREVRYFEKKKDGFHPHDGFLGIEKMAGRETYKFKKEDDLLSSQGYLKGDSAYTVSSSQSKDYVSSGILREGFPRYSANGGLNMPSDVIRRGSELASQPIGFDGYCEKKQNMFPGGQLDDTRSSARLYMGLPEEKEGDQLYAEFGRSKIGSMSARLNDVGDEYRDQNMSRVDVRNPTDDKFSHKRPVRDDGLWDQYPFSHVQSTPDKFEASGSLHGKTRDLDMLGTGSSHLNYGTEEYHGYGGLKQEAHHVEVDGGQWSHVERPEILQSRDYDPSFGRRYDSPRKRSTLEDLSFVEPSERRLRYKHVRDEVSYEHDLGIRISTDGNGSRKIYNQVHVRDDFDRVNLSKKPKFSKPSYKKTWRISSEMANERPSSSKWHPANSVKTYKSDSRDVKERLGPPIPPKLHVSQRLVRKYKPSIKKRLAPAPSRKHATVPWIKNLNSNMMESVQDDSNGTHDHDLEHREDHLPLAKPEPPEKSEDFKQLMQSAFFKFLKQLNETPIKRKKYMEQGKAGSLKCIVCGSNSDEFVDTESLAMHAFTSEKVGLRSQHLGLHKALCALMGWKIAEDHNSEWHCEVMSSAEISALKEDLIIWPPVVIVHNSTIDNKNPDERVVVSTEKVDMKLRDMGFRSILKVCNGKPANQSVMLVRFNGTLSGLQEAERFHMSYVQSRHGRLQLNLLKSDNGSSSGGTPVISAEREDDILYGYLGIAEDLDKLDFDTKKRCVLRSKKEILSIVDAP